MIRRKTTVSGMAAKPSETRGGQSIGRGGCNNQNVTNNWGLLDKAGGNKVIKRVPRIKKGQKT